jgi:hypothetical protein
LSADAVAEWSQTTSVKNQNGPVVLHEACYARVSVGEEKAFAFQRLKILRDNGPEFASMRGSSIENRDLIFQVRIPAQLDQSIYRKEVANDPATIPATDPANGPVYDDGNEA